MIVETMTYQEIADEFKKDWERSIRHKITDCFGMANKYRRYILKEGKTDKWIRFKPIEFTSPRGNNCVIQFVSKGWADYKRNGLIFVLYMYYYKSEGLYAVMIAGDNFDEFSFYTPHLFDRYRERKLKDISKPKLQTMFDFFKTNATSRFNRVNNDKYANSIFSVCPNGVTLGSEISDKIIENRTYITFEMLKSDQVQDEEKLGTALKDYLDKQL